MLRIATLGYHDVTDDPRTSGFQRRLAIDYKHTREAFGKHLDAIAASYVSPGLVTDIDFAAAGDHLLLTFDDGGKSARYISDVLCRRGWRGHFFVTTGLMGRATFLDRRDIVQLRHAGHLIGSHSHTHPDIFKAQPWQAMLHEWRVSADALSQLLGEPCFAGSVPGGDISRQVFESAETSGFRYLFTSEPQLSPRLTGRCHVLGRFFVKATTPLASITDAAALRGWRIALLRRQFSVIARSALPPLYRHYVRTRTRDSEFQRVLTPDARS